MAYVLNLQTDEKLLVDVHYQPSEKNLPFRLAITDKAFYVPATRFVVVGDPHYLETVPLSRVKQVIIQPISAIGYYLMAMLLLGVGGYILYNFGFAGWALKPRGLGISLAFVVGGLLLPFAARGRYRLAIATETKQYRWKPPIVVGTAAQREQKTIFDNIASASKSLGVAVQDERR